MYLCLAAGKLKTQQQLLALRPSRSGAVTRGGWVGEAKNKPCANGYRLSLGQTPLGLYGRGDNLEEKQ